MTRYYLTKLKIEGFRGINNDGDSFEIKFKNDAVNSVYAHNGQGKSSIYEALCYAIRGDVSKLANLPQEENPSAYYNNFFHSSQESVIELTFSPDDASQDIVITVLRDSSGARNVSSNDVTDPVSFLEEMNREFCLLDYNTFAEFIENSALIRGRSFSSLLGLASFSTMHQTINTLSDTRTFNRDFGIKALEEQQKNFESDCKKRTAAVSSAFNSLTGEVLEVELNAPELVTKSNSSPSKCNATYSLFSGQKYS